MKLTENDWLFLNDLVYRVNRQEDISLLQKTFLEAIKILIPCDEATFFLYDGDTLHSPVCINSDESVISKYLDTYKETDFISWIFSSSKSAVLRETDLLPDDIREDTPYYKEYCRPFNIHFCIILALVHDGAFVGLVDLFRTKDKEEFSEREFFILDAMKEHLALRLFQLTGSANAQGFGSRAAEETLKRTIERYKLTNREAEILELLEAGLSNQDISNRLYVSLPTLKRHISNIYKKFDVKNRFQLSKKLLS